MSLPRGRTAVAFLLTLVAVAVPSAAWFLAGSGQIAREAQAQKSSAYHLGYKHAVKVAERLHTRLELLRVAESKRPFYHYQNLFHDPKGVAEGVAVSLSPLAQGPTDALIEAHFQIDETGQLTLPTINDEFPELSLESLEDAQCDLLWKLRDVAVLAELEPSWRESLERNPSSSSKVWKEKLSAQAWQQNLDANALFADLKYPGKNRVVHRKPESKPAIVEISVKSFTWHTLPIADQPALIALRRVGTPAGAWLQGFLITRDRLAQLLDETEFPSSVAPTEEMVNKPDGFSAAEVGDTGWAVLINVSSKLDEVRRRAEEEKSSFLRFFFFGTMAAGIAGALLVFLVAQSERLAQQRIRFAASAAHELRTPLAGLRLYGEMLSEGLGDPARAQDYARRIAGEAERLGRVVTNVLSFTRLERGGLQVHPALGDLAEAVADAVLRQRLALEQAGATVELSVAEDLPQVRFDRDAVAHIVQNLLDNAEKYTRDQDDRRILLQLEAQDHAVTLEVRDHGQGLPKHLSGKLFRPFVRGNDQDGPEGLGLGLVLVKNLVDAQGATIRYEEAPGGGASFLVAFPRG